MSQFIPPKAHDNYSVEKKQDRSKQTSKNTNVVLKNQSKIGSGKGTTVRKVI